LGEHTDSHLKEIIDKLDDLFLYLSTVPTILFTIIQAALGEEMLLVFLPILIPTFVALYIGYIRGAITVNTIGERLRGWVYLIVTILFYPIYYCVTYSYLWIYPSDILLIAPLLGVALGYVVLYRFIPFFANLGWRKRPKIERIINSTYSASFYLVIASWAFSCFVLACLRNSPNWYIPLFFSISFSIGFIILELRARQIASKL